MTTNLITKYRPNNFADVVGQQNTVKSLQGICRRGDSQIFLFSGPPGVGKTTLARIVAKTFGVENTQSALIEIDAASKTGVEDMRQLQELLMYRPFGDSGKRALIIDECQRLSRNAWESLLKALEDPPEHVIWCFCTTEPTKVPPAVRTRCSKFELKLVSDQDLSDLLDIVCIKEKIELPANVHDLLIKEAKGSPRQLLSNLVIVRTAKNKKEAAELLSSVTDNDASFQLCQYIVNGNGSWSTCMGLINKLEESANAESIRLLIVNYLGSCLKNAKTNDQAGSFLEKLDAFSNPYNGTEGIAPLLLSIGRALFSE